MESRGCEMRVESLPAFRHIAEHPLRSQYPWFVRPAAAGTA